MYTFSLIHRLTAKSRTETLATLLLPSYSSRRDSEELSDNDLQAKRDELRHALQSSQPKQVLQSLAFLTSHSTQSLKKTYRLTTPRLKPSTAERTESEINLLPLKQSLLDNCEKLLSLQSGITNMPKKEYATVEAKCRALRAARTAALDRLDEIISSSEPERSNEDWNDDVAAAKELIVNPFQSVTQKVEMFRNNVFRE